MKILIAIAAGVLIAGCGFKSELYLPDAAADADPGQPELNDLELPPLPSLEELSEPGVPVEIPVSEDDLSDNDNNKKKK